MPRLRSAFVHARPFLPIRLALVVALVVAGLALGRPGAGPDRVAAIAATQSSLSVIWSFSASTSTPPAFFNVNGVMPLAPAGSTQTWTVDLQPGSGVEFGGFGPTLSGSAPYCQLFSNGTLRCINSGATTVSVVVRVTLPQAPAVYEVVGVGLSSQIAVVEANTFLVATAAAQPCVTSAGGHTVIRQGAAGTEGRC